MQMQAAAIPTKSRNHMEVGVKYGLTGRPSIGKIEAYTLALKVCDAECLCEIFGNRKDLPGFFH